MLQRITFVVSTILATPVSQLCAQVQASCEAWKKLLKPTEPSLFLGGSNRQLSRCKVLLKC